MLQRGFRFEFAAPDDWILSRGGSRYVYHGPAGEELIVSGFILEGTGSPAEISAALQQLVANATNAVLSAASNPDLETFKAFREDEGAVTPPLKCWTVHSQTRAQDVMFCQAVVSASAAVLLVTFEAPNVPDRLTFYRKFLRDIRVAPVH